MPLYDYKCKGCVDKDEDGNDHPRHLETLVCSMKEIADRAKPVCPECREPMVRVMNQAVFMTYQQSKGIFPQTFHDWGNKPVTCYDRTDMKEKMKLHDRSHAEPSDNVRYKARQMKKGKTFSPNPTKP